MENRETLLIVEASAVNRAMLAEIFAAEYQLAEVGDGREALALLRKRPEEIFAVLLAMHMPRMDGFAVLEEMKRDPLLAEIPVVMVTALDEPENEARALQCGAVDFVGKPFVPAVLLQRVRNVAHRRRLERALSEKMLTELDYRANHDPLTGIYNKEAFYRMTAELLQKNPGSKFVLLRWNIERFKLINELFGKEAGDSILRRMAETFQNKMPAVGTYGRLEADHFAICLPAKYLDAPRFLAQTVALIETLDIRYAVSVDFGIYEIDDPDIPVDQMCDRANLALQTIKGKYKQHYALYNDAMRQTMLREQEIRSEMAEALADREFQVFLQPIYSLSTGRAVSAEALVRWRHPKKGMISPGEFIPLFEKNGFIAELDHYVWEEVCRYLGQRKKRGLARLPISVNASRMSLYSPDFLDQVVGLTEQYEVEPALFKIEITETAYAADPAQLMQTTRNLQAAGFPVLMDDFGSGYSSLNTLKDLPVDILKIDMKFLEGFECGGRVGTVLISVLRMAKWLNLPVIAEGVETEEQLAFLRSAGCDLIQGFCFARPMAMEAFEDYIGTIPAGGEETGALSFSREDFDSVLGGNRLINRLMDGMFGGFGLYEYNDDYMEILRANDGYYSLLGDTPETLMADSRDIWAHTFAEDVEKSKAACREAIRTEQAVHLLVRRYHRDGRLLYLDTIVRHLGGGSQGTLLCIAFNDITRQLENERRMREEQERYRLISESSGTVVLEWNLADDSFQADAGVAQYAIGGLEHHNRAEFARVFERGVHPDDVARLRAFVSENGRTYHTVTARLKMADGAYHFCRISESAILDETGRPERILGTINDVDEEYRAGLQLDKRNAQLQGIMDNLPGAIGIFDIVGDRLRLQSASDGLMKMTGFSREKPGALYGDENFTGVHPEDAPELFAKMERSIAEGVPLTHSYRFLRQDGSYAWISLSASPLRVGGELKYYGIFTDVSELRSKSDQLQTIMDNVDSGITLFEGIGKTGKMLYANENFYRMIGYERAEFDREIGDFFELVPGVYRKTLQAAARQMLSGKQAAELEFPLEKKNGDRIWVQRRCTPMTLPGHQEPVFVTTLTDITERKERQHSNELHRYSNALLGVYDEIYEVDYARGRCTVIASRLLPKTKVGTSYSLEEALAQWIQGNVWPGDWMKLLSLTRRPKLKTTPPVEYRVGTKEAYRWVSSVLLHVEGDSYLICNMDVTTRRQAELLAEENNSLRLKQQEQERYQIIVEQTGAVVLEWDFRSRIFAASEGYAGFQISRQDPFALWDTVFAATDETLVRQLEKQDGTAVWCRVTRTDVRDTMSGEVLRSIASITNVEAEKQAEQQLRYRDQLAQILLADSDTLTFDYYTGTTRLYVNYVDKAGGRANRTIPRFRDFVRRAYMIQPDDRELLLQMTDAARPMEGSLEFRGDFSGHGYRWYRLTYASLPDESGRVHRIVGKAVDITESRKAESRYREELDFTRALGVGLVSSCRINLTTRCVEYSRGEGWENQLSVPIPVSDALFLQHADGLLADSGERAGYVAKFCPSQLLTDYENGVTEQEMEYRARMADGTIRWLHLRVKLLKKPDSPEVVAFYNAWDIHEKHMAREVIDSVVTLDYDYLMYIRARDHSYALFSSKKAGDHSGSTGGNYDETCRHRLATAVHPDDRARMEKQLDLDEVGRQLEKRDSFALTLRILTKDGGVAHKRLTFSHMNADGDLIMTRRDITGQVLESQRQREVLLKALEEAKRANRAKEDFLSRMSHELRTPMNAVIGLAGLALEEPLLPIAAGEYLSKIQYASEYLLSLLSDILDVSRIEAGKFRLHEAPLALRDFLEQLETIVKPAMVAKNIRFQVELCCGADMIALVDKVRVLQVFVNLLTNATKFTPVGGEIALVIRMVEETAADCRMHFEVRDTGIGMSRDFLDKLFLPFTQERTATDDYGGAGLGLTIVKKIVDAMQGTIAVDSRVDGGTTVTMELPLQTVQEDSAHALPEILPDFFDFSGRRALLVEDHPINAEIAARLLKKKGFAVELAVNGQEAVEKFAASARGAYSAILMDIRMPVMDGLTATRQIRAQNRDDAKTIPIIAMTANVFDSDVQESLSAGLDAHLDKPIAPKQLYQTLAALIFSREGGQQYKESERRIRQQEKIYKMLLTESRSRIFEYTPATDCFVYSETEEDGRRTVHTLANYHNNLMRESAVHPRFREEILAALDVYSKTGGEDELLFQADFEGTGYRWYEGYFKSVTDGAGKVARIVGKMDDVDKKTKRTLALREKAEYDGITGLYNRATYEEMVENALADHNRGLCAFVEFDLDNFKQVNDTYGHLAGDKLLHAVAAAVTKVCRKEDLVGRLGGDEFAIWFFEAGNADNVVEKTREISRRIQEITDRMELQVDVTASFGIVMVAPGECSFRSLFRKSDEAMYAVKRSGKNDYQVYHPEK